MKTRYRDINFSPWRLALIEHAENILDEYSDQGVELTLRGLYYKFVSRKLFPDNWANAEGVTNRQESYDKLGILMTEARYAGLIDWSYLPDITRELEGGGGLGDPQKLIKSLADGYSLSMWDDQPVYAEIWMEKDAVSSLVSTGCDKHNLPYYSCRGYMGAAAMHESALRFARKIREGKRVLIGHLGDHDPSGVDMSRDITDRISEMLGKQAAGFELRRLGLNMSQIRALDLPPDPAKLSDGRAAAYMEKYNTRFSWELDALEPETVYELIDDFVEGIIDPDIWKARKELEQTNKDVMLGISDNWHEVIDFIEGLE
jgi:hypothetical protein